MKNFKLWLETKSNPEFAALVAAIIANRYDYTPRLVIADWLDEHNDPQLAKLLRLSYDLRQDDRKYDDPEVKEKRAELKKLTDEQFYKLRAQGIQYNNYNNRIFFKDDPVGSKEKVYQLQANGILKANSNNVFTKANVNEFPDQVLKGILVLLCHKMSDDSKVTEQEDDISTSYNEFNKLVQQIRSRGYGNDVPKIWWTRLQTFIKGINSVITHDSITKEFKDDIIEEFSALRFALLYRNITNRPLFDLLYQGIALAKST